MNNCIELIYDRFGMEFYRTEDIEFKMPMMVKGKFLSSDDVTILDRNLYLAVGNFSCHTGKQINANDTYGNITTKVSEKKDDELYVVSIHFEFANPTHTAVSLCEALDYTPYSIVLNHFDFTGNVSARRIIRNEEGQSRVEITEDKGIISVDITVRNVNGIQHIS